MGRVAWNLPGAPGRLECEHGREPMAPRNSLHLAALAGAFAAAIASAPAAGAILGFHDVSDPVKTLGWACNPAAAAPVRVLLYAEVDGALTLLDTQLADKRRDDLVTVCGGTGHAFRFSDYARTPEGIALYGNSNPVRIHVFAETDQGRQLLSASPRPVSFAPAGLWDPGLGDGRWRTDFDNPLEGTGAAPLLLGDCQFPPALPGEVPLPVKPCRYGSVVSPASNAASSAAAWPLHSYWAVIGNVEEAFDNPLCAAGPPGQSMPFDSPGQGALFGVIALPDGEAGMPARKKMHLVLNSWNQAACRTQSYGIPYLSFGAQAERGNNGIVTYLNVPGARTRLGFGMTLMDLADANPDAFGKVPDGVERYSQAHVLIEAMWGGRKRWLFIELLPDARRNPDAPGAGIDAHVRFNWHMVNSFIYPGADYLYKSAAVLTGQCRQEGIVVPAQSRMLTYRNAATRAQSRRDYSLDLQRVFACLNRIGAWGSEAMPAHAVPVTGLHFGIEQDDRLYRDGAFTGATAPNAVWIAVDSVRLEAGTP